MPSGPMLWARLPAGGWQIGFWVDSDGRTLVDVADSWGARTYRMAGGRAAPSIDAGWAGSAPTPAGDAECWALAIGHAPAGYGHVVSFIRSADEAYLGQLTLPPEALSGFWMSDSGLWVAAAVGRYTHVRLIAQGTTLLHPLHPVAAVGSGPEYVRTVRAGCR